MVTFNDLDFKPTTINGVECPMERQYPNYLMRYMDFEDCIWGKYAQMYFDNGLGISVVQHGGKKGETSYGADRGLYEVAMLYEKTGKLVRVADVDGWLTEEEVTKRMHRIERIDASLIVKFANKKTRWDWDTGEIS